MMKTKLNKKKTDLIKKRKEVEPETNIKKKQGLKPDSKKVKLKLIINQWLNRIVVIIVMLFILIVLNLKINWKTCEISDCSNW